MTPSEYRQMAVHVDRHESKRRMERLIQSRSIRGGWTGQFDTASILMIVLLLSLIFLASLGLLSDATFWATAHGVN